MSEGFSGNQVAAIVGITYRQVDHWARTDLIRPSLADATGSGSRRQYSYTDLRALQIVKQLLDAGFRLDKIRTIFDELRRILGEEITAANLVIEGSSVSLMHDGELLDLLKRGQGVFNMNISKCIDDLDARIIALHAESSADAELPEAVAH